MCRGAWLSDLNSRKAIIIYSQISSRFTASVAFYRHIYLKPQKVKKYRFCFNGQYVDGPRRDLQNKMKANLYVERKQNYKAMSSIVFKCSWFVLLILRLRRTQNEFCTKTRPCNAERERTSQTYEKKIESPACIWVYFYN